jgi:hypothetical protein
MKMEELIFSRLPGESYSDQKKRFQEALDVIVPHMDKYFSGPTARKFKHLSRVHIRTVKQRGAVNWDVLKYWYEEYLPKTELAVA